MATKTGCFSREVRASPGVCADQNIRSSHGKCDHLRRDRKPIQVPGHFGPSPGFIFGDQRGEEKTQNRLFLEEVRASTGVFVVIKTSDFLAGNRTIYVVIAKPKQLF